MFQLKKAILSYKYSNWTETINKNSTRYGKNNFKKIKKYFSKLQILLNIFYVEHYEL